MKCTIPLTPCESKQLAAFGYDPTTQRLAVTFKQKNGTSLPYEYPCTPEFYKELCEAPSKGKFFNARIKNNAEMPHQKMIPDEEAAA